MGATRSRLAKIERLCDLLKRLEGSERRIAVPWLAGRLRQGRIGVGPALLREARPSHAAERAGLEIEEVDRRFEQIAAVSGAGAKAARREQLATLLGEAKLDEQRFLIALLHGEVRHGALEGVMIEAVASATGLPAQDVRRATMLAGDAATVATAALEDGAEGLSRFRLTLFRPVQPMLAQPAESLEAAIEASGPHAVEAKLDGARVQVHRRGDRVRVFSRQLNDVTDAVPEVVEAALAAAGDDFVLDGEVLALREDGRPRAFQETMRRFGRRRDVQALRETLPLTPCFFDLLHLDGTSWIERSARDRFAALEALLPGQVVPRIYDPDLGAAQRFLRRTLESGHEGVMLKQLDTPYEAGSRGASWWKVKPVHTLDLVVLAAEWGSGRRKGWLSNLHLGARDPETGDFVMLGKTFKGLTDETLAWQTGELETLATRRDGHTVYVAPQLVVEIAFSDVQRSPQYPAGLALRFARVLRYRPDKTAIEADSIDTVRRILERGHTGGTPAE